MWIPGVQESSSSRQVTCQKMLIVYSSVLGREDIGAGTQSIKGAHGTRLLIGLCPLLKCVSNWMLLDTAANAMMQVWKRNRTEKTILSLNVKDIFCPSQLLELYYIIVIEFTGYGDFAVVEKNIPVLFKIEFYSNPVLNLFIFWMIMIMKTGLISIIRRTRK